MMAIEDNNTIGLSAVPTLVVGLGKTGLSCVRFLVTNGVSVAVTDSRTNPPGLDDLRKEFSQVECSVGGFDANLFDRADRLVVSPGVAIDNPLIIAARERGAEIVGDVELFVRLAQAPIVAITGSNGKSTVTTLVADMVKASGKQVLMGGNIGTPVLELLEYPVPDFYVLELSSFQLETTRSLDAVAAVVLNVSPDHMDRYHDLAHYAVSKQRIYGVEGCGHGVMVVNRDDAIVMSMQDQLSMQDQHRKTISFGLDKADGKNFGRILYQDELWLARGQGPLLPVRELRIAGEHNQANALAALALGEQIGLPIIAMLNALREFKGLPHRTQWVADINGVSWFNDSKGTNVGATISAIRGFTQPVVLIAGGQGKGADFTSLGNAVKEKVRAAILFGEDAPFIEAALANTVPLHRVLNLDEAVLKAHAIAQPGDVVLLSPACASFDMFSGFEARGDAFINAVLRLQNEARS